MATTRYRQNGRELIVELARKGWTAKKLAEKTGISIPIVLDAVNGKSTRKSFALLIAATLKRKVEALFVEEVKPKQLDLAAPATKAVP